MTTQGNSQRPATQFREELLRVITNEIVVRGWSQKECEAKLSMRQARVSELLNRKADAFSCDKLIDIAASMELTFTVSVARSRD